MSEGVLRVDQSEEGMLAKSVEEANMQCEGQRQRSPATDVGRLTTARRTGVETQ